MALYAPPGRQQQEPTGTADVGLGSFAERLAPGIGAGDLPPRAPAFAAPAPHASGSGSGWADVNSMRNDVIPRPTSPRPDRLGQRPRVDPRLRLSQLLSKDVASGRYATGRIIDPRRRDPSMPQACMPRIKLKAMGNSLALPLSKRQTDKLKAAQVDAGQERDVNADGVPETRLPWAVRPDADFKIVNHKAWSTGVVAPAVKEVGNREVGSC